MTLKPQFWIFFAICFIPAFLSAQTNDSKTQKTLDQKVKENRDLLMTGSENAFDQIDDLIQQGKKQGNKEAELSLLSQRCWYYVKKNDLKSAIRSAQELDAKAIEYDNLFWQAASHGHLLEIYSFSNLPEQAIDEFEKSIRLFNQSKQKNDAIEHAKAINHIKVASVYESKGDFGTAKKMLIKADKYIGNIKNDESRKRIRFFNFSNLAAINIDLNLTDSAEYFVHQSILLGNEDDENVHSVQVRNYILLGQIYNDKKDYREALLYLKQAEKSEPRVSLSLLEKNTLYKELTETYKALDSTVLVNNYSSKAKDIEIELEKSKNSSLHKIIEDDLLKENNKSTPLLIGSGVLLLLSFVLIFRLYRRNNLLARQEIISEQYLKENKYSVNPVNDEQLSKLLELLKQNDPAFMSIFHSVFPKFLEKLKSIHPNIVQTELEFCAMMKLNIPTKEIARTLNIEPKSVQAKKYRIRKKLSIPNETDIYMWFNQL